MEELTLKKLREIQLSILKEVAAFCDNHGINYFLCGGTLLGAIRHKGYIPWDDDIDIMLPRPDYEKLLIHFKSEDLVLHSSKRDDNFINPFVKISDKRTILIENISNGNNIGVNIDVFPIDGFPEGQDEMKNHIRKIGRLRKILSLQSLKYRSERSFFKNITVIFTKPFVLLLSPKKISERIEQEAIKYSFDHSKKAGIAVWGYGDKEVCPKKAFVDNIVVSFEGINFKAPLNYDLYLSTVYGNYMELPPENKRISHHDFKAYLKL